MVIILLFGLLGLLRLNVQSLPDFGFDLITVSVDWKSASPRDIENQVIKSIEPEVRTIDGVRKVNSVAREGVGQLSIEFVKNTDMQRALSDVNSAISRIQSLPEDSEKPKVRRIIRYETVGRLLLYGDVSENKLRDNAKTIRDDLLNLGIDKVNILGIRDKEIIVAVDPLSLMTFKKSMQDLADKIYAFSKDFPAGTIEDLDTRKIKLVGNKTTIEDLKELSIISGEFGEQVYLKDIANIYINYDSEGEYGLINNKQALSLDIKRAAGRNSLEMARILENYVSNFQKKLPANLNIKIYDLSVQSVRDRINLLIKNGLGGLVLVVIILFLFLSGRVAFWVAFGIPIALAGTLGVMLISGQTINMVSLFALIMMLGIIVDDAIVVAEYAQTCHENGDDAYIAAKNGASRMFLPVFTAAITTVAAFIPIFLISGIIGQVIEAIPLVAIAVLIASLVECFLILPGHLSLALNKKKIDIGNFRLKFNKYFFHVRQNYFRKWVSYATHYRYITLSSTFAILIIVMGLMSGGRISFVFFPSPEPDIVYVNFNFSPGTPRENSIFMIAELERALKEADNNNEVQTHFSIIGRSLGLPGSVQQIQGQHIGAMVVELVSSDKRITEISNLINIWKNNIVKPAGLESMTISSKRQGPPGKDIDIRIIPKTLDNDILQAKLIANDVKSLLAKYEGVSDIYDDLPWGKEELVLKLRPLGKSLGFTTLEVSNQISAAFRGIIIQRFSDGSEEILIRIRYDSKQLKEIDLKNMFIMSSKNNFIPLSQIVEIEYEKGFSIIRRENGKTEISVTAEIDEKVIAPATILGALSAGPLDEIISNKGHNWRLAGRSEEQTETLTDMKIGTIIGLILIYIILSGVFSSYFRPLIVMSIIPFAALGSIIGHWITGFNITILSLVALLGLAGIVINDSIIMVSTIDDKIKKGVNIINAVINGACERFRAVILTSLTTISGLIPLLFEGSTQAQFLKPMAVTIVFGLIATTFLVLFLVPALVLVQDDFKNSFNKIRMRLFNN
tara:strand:- start:2123 stop:5176 length:3054 start_codon:yes stop_codon:yes gene_type:complete